MLMNASSEYIRTAKLEKRKKLGQYFTSKNIRDIVMSYLPRASSPHVLEPACGTGEFLQSIYGHFDNPVVKGFDIDPDVVSIAQDLFPQADIQRGNTLNIKPEPVYDFVIGNPPYFEFVPNKTIKKIYGDVISGRANIYGLFVKYGLDSLKEGGYLAYVIPPSMNNGAYFAKLREYVISNSNIERLHIIESSDMFEDAQQKVMILVLKKGKNNRDYIFRRGNICLFSAQSQWLNEQFEGKKTLFELGYRVKTGTVVWNQNKDALTDDKSKPLLVWAHNIGSDNKMRLYNNDKKKQHVDVSRWENDTAIVVNRITGSGQNARVRAALIPKGKVWVAENHVNVVYRLEKGEVSFRQLHKALVSPEALRVVQFITGNTQLSKTELENLVPIGV